MNDIAPERLIAGLSLAQWEQKLPLFKKICARQEVFWTNPALESCLNRRISADFSIKDIEEAAGRLARFAPYLVKVFPETAATGGIIESALQAVPNMASQLQAVPWLEHGGAFSGALYLKRDDSLPISGSVKARGGIHEVLKVAEDIAFKHGLLRKTDNYAVLAEERFRQLFSGYRILVGSTGNLGLSIGIMSARLGFQVIVHMSAEAKEWKKELLRAKGAQVVEHAGDYGAAVSAGRQEAQSDARSHFVDDENSTVLFLGYAVAALRLQEQLAQMHIAADAEHPLFVYLPCGVGGAPGGITFGLRSVFGDNAHCFFAEPLEYPAMLLGLMSGRHNALAAEDFGLGRGTAADGLAVGRPSGFVGKTLAKDISGVFTVPDDKLYQMLRLLADTEGIFLEPSALAGFSGPSGLCSSPAGLGYVQRHNLTAQLPRSTHIVWATGGGMVPPQIIRDFYNNAK